MDKIVDLFLKTPLAKRYAAGYIERGLMLVCLWLAKQISDDFAASIQSDVAKMAIEATPILVAALFAWIAKARMKKVEVTIAVAHASDQDVSRAAIDQQTKVVLKDPSASKAA